MAVLHRLVQRKHLDRRRRGAPERGGERINAGDGAENLGWSCREGNQVFTASRCRSGTRYHAPRFTYGRDVGTSIVGGFVYRGQRYRALLGGQYIAGDFVSGRIFRWFNGQSATPRVA